MQQVKEAREKMMQEHEESIKKMKEMAEQTISTDSMEIQEWMKLKLAEHSKTKEQQEEEKLKQEKQKQVKDLQDQQQQIQDKINELMGSEPQPREKDDPWEQLKLVLSQGSKEKDQRLLLQQLKSSLTGKPEEDPNRAILRSLLTSQNKTTATSGANTLKPELLNKIIPEDTGPGSMAEWLASLNRQEEGESWLTHNRNKFDFRQETDSDTKGAKTRSGMLEKAANNIIRKEVWPQQNLGEDWAEDQVDYKHIKFEQLVAGECRTIETCTEPAQILGRLKLLRRLAYLKLRGFEWGHLRRLYAAILSSIETGEYSWESNFDRFETILYRRPLTDMRQPAYFTGDRERPDPSKRRFCRDFNKQGCSKNSPHPVWSGSGPSATKKLVYHYCAPCLLKDRACREHPEGHSDCPHKD